jgi:hypothetical protein
VNVSLFLQAGAVLASAAFGKMVCKTKLFDI